MDGTVSLQSAGFANLGDLSARGWRRSGGLAWNDLLPFGEYMASSGLLRLSSPRFQDFGYFPRARPPFVFHSAVLPSRLVTAWPELDLQFELQSLLISLIFCCFAVTPGVGLT